jgi:hypothetical protein
VFRTSGIEFGAQKDMSEGHLFGCPYFAVIILKFNIM